MDALAYLRLGKVFTANMTGNTVLLAMAIGQREAQHAARSAVAVAAFCAGAALAAALDAPQRGFAIEVVLLLVTALLARGFAAIATAAAAMGCQTGTIRRRNTTGVNATYITGTVTELMSRLTDRVLGRDFDAERGGVGLPAAVWAGYAGGGIGGALLSEPLGAGAFAVAAAAPAVILITARTRRAVAGG